MANDLLDRANQAIKEKRILFRSGSSGFVYVLEGIYGSGPAGVKAQTLSSGAGYEPISIQKLENATLLTPRDLSSDEAMNYHAWEREIDTEELIQLTRKSDLDGEECLRSHAQTQPKCTVDQITIQRQMTERAILDGKSLGSRD